MAKWNTDDRLPTVGNGEILTDKERREYRIARLDWFDREQEYNRMYDPDELIGDYGRNKNHR